MFANTRLPPVRRRSRLTRSIEVSTVTPSLAWARPRWARSATQGRRDPQSRLIQPVTIIKGVQSRPRKSSLVPSPPHLPRPINPSRTRTKKRINQIRVSIPATLWLVLSDPSAIFLFRNKHSGDPSSQSGGLFSIPVQSVPDAGFLIRRTPRILGLAALVELTRPTDP